MGVRLFSFVGLATAYHAACMPDVLGGNRDGTQDRCALPIAQKGGGGLYGPSSNTSTLWCALQVTPTTPMATAPVLVSSEQRTHGFHGRRD